MVESSARMTGKGAMSTNGASRLGPIIRPMSPPGQPSRQRAAASFGGAPAGPALTSLKSVAARIARTIRCLAIAYTCVQVIVWHSFYAASPWLLAWPAAQMLWGAAAVAYLGRRWPGWQLAVIDTGVHLALALGAMASVPAAMRGDAANWLYIAMLGQLFIPAWFAPTAVFAPLAVAAAAGYWTGAKLTMTPASAHNSPAAAAALILAVGAANWCGRRMLYRWANRADAALARADADARAQYVVLSRNIERREHERLLHDTVLNTLTALARAGRGDAVVGRCRHDVTLMEHALGDPGDPAHAAGRAYDSLLAGVEAVAIEMRARGLDVHVRVTRSEAGGDNGSSAGSAPAGPDGAPAVPAPVAAAIAHAVREALANVASHAGTGEAWVEIIERAPGVAAEPGVAAAEPGGLKVTVRDAGTGFDPARVDPARLGLRRSIIERIADQGGRVSVQSAPGRGTVVSMCWTAAAEPRHVAVNADALPAGSPGMVSRDHALPDASEAELARMTGSVAVAWQLILLVQVLIDLHAYRHPALPVAVWLGMLAAAAALVPKARAGGLTGRQAAVAIAVAVTAVALIGGDRAQGASGTVDWSVFGTGWLLALVAVSRPARAWISGALLIFSVHVAFSLRVLGVTSLGLARLGVTAYTLVVILAVFAALRRTVHAQAVVAARRAALTSQSEAERAAAAAVQEDRGRRLVLLEAEALPLLRGIADGTLDPADCEVRDRCARHAATLRRALADRPRQADEVLAELEPALRAARARGLPVEVQVVGDPGRPIREVAGATLAAVNGVMIALPPQPVTLTVLASRDDVELYVTFDRPPLATIDVAGLRRTVPATARWRSTVDVDDTGAGCLEVRWWKAVPA
jgi:signal transduction histidine kinase